MQIKKVRNIIQILMSSLLLDCREKLRADKISRPVSLGPNDKQRKRKNSRMTSCGFNRVIVNVPPQFSLK